MVPCLLTVEQKQQIIQRAVWNCLRDLISTRSLISKRWSKGFGSNEEVLAATEACFEAKGKSFYEKGIESLEEKKGWNDYIAM